MWEVKTDDNTLHDKDWTYSWYEPDMTKNGGLPGTVDGGNCGATSQCDTYGLVTVVNTKGWCGFNDWRVPTRQELISIVNYGQFGNAIERKYFPDTFHPMPTTFWTSTPSSRSIDDAIVIDFLAGESFNGYRASAIGYRVRLVRNVN